MAPKHQAPRGTRDLLPEDTARWRWVEERARVVLERYGFGELRTPMFEEYELFARTSGESSDVVQKEMYKFTDLGERELALRPGWPSMFRGYWGEPGRYRKCFAGDWYLTGDLARRDRDGTATGAARPRAAPSTQRTSTSAKAAYPLRETVTTIA